MAQFSTVCRSDELKPDSRRVFHVGNYPVLIIASGGRYFGVDSHCACIVSEVGHPGTRRPDQLMHDAELASLEDAPIENGRITCPEHQSVYDMASGNPVSGFAEVPLNTWEVRERDGQIEVATSSNAERLLANDL